MGQDLWLRIGAVGALSVKNPAPSESDIRKHPSSAFRSLFKFLKSTKFLSSLDKIPFSPSIYSSTIEVFNIPSLYLMHSEFHHSSPHIIVTNAYVNNVTIMDCLLEEVRDLTARWR